jgi:hypothetical protein
LHHLVLAKWCNGDCNTTIRVSYDHVRKWDADERKKRIAARRAEATRRLGAN